MDTQKADESRALREAVEKRVAGMLKGVERRYQEEQSKPPSDAVCAYRKAEAEWQSQCAEIRGEAARTAFSGLCERATGLAPVGMTVTHHPYNSLVMQFEGKPKIDVQNCLLMWGELRKYVPGRTEWEAARYLALAYVAFGQVFPVTDLDCVLPWYLPDDLDEVLATEHPPTAEEAATDIRWMALEVSDIRPHKTGKLPPDMLETTRQLDRVNAIRLCPDGTSTDLPLVSVGMRIVGPGEPEVGAEKRFVYQADWVAALHPRRAPGPRPPVRDIALPEYPVRPIELTGDSPETTLAKRARWLKGDGIVRTIVRLGADYLWLASVMRYEAAERAFVIEWGNDDGEPVTWIKAINTGLSDPVLHRYTFYDAKLCPAGVCINRFDRATFEMMAKALGAPSVETLLNGLTTVSGLAIRCQWPAPAAPGTICMRNLRPCSQWAYAINSRGSFVKMPAPESTPELCFELARDTCVFPGTHDYRLYPSPRISMLSSDRRDVTVVLSKSASPVVPGWFFRDDWHGVELMVREHTLHNHQLFVTLRAPDGYIFSF